MRHLFKALIKADPSDLFGRAMSAGFWATALRIVLRTSIIVRTIILARLLAPDDFGLMAIATLSITLLDRFTQSGFEAALVQKSEDVRPYLDTAWTLQIVRGSVMGVSLVLLAPWISQFFREPEAQAIIQVLAVAVLARGFVNVSVITFVKDLRFDKLFVLQIAGKGTEVAVSIVAALVLRNVWALVIGVIVGEFGRLVASYLIDPYRPRLRWVQTQVRQLFRFGKWVLLTQILQYFSGNLDDILVGRVLGTQSLGLYRMAFNFSQAVATEISQVTNQVAFPTYSKLQDASVRLRTAYLGSVHLVAFLGVPLAVGTILLAEDLTLGILGSKWELIIVPMQLLSVAGLIRGISSTSGPLFLSQGRPDIPPRFTFAKIVIMAILIFPALNRFGIDGAAAVVAFAALVTGVLALWLAFSTIHASGQEVAQVIGFPMLNSVSIPISILAAKSILFPSPSIVSFVVLTIIGGGAYALSILVSTKLLRYRAPQQLVARIRRATDGAA